MRYPSMNKNILIGREAEKKTLLYLLTTPEAELVSVIGRRRVGKTYLVRQVYKDQIKFEITGLQHGGLKEQLAHFVKCLQIYFPGEHQKAKPKTWMDAFHILIEALTKLNEQDKPVIFFDELPWISSPKSGFLQAFGFFWNSWAVKQQIIVVICGSAASWMIQKVVRDKGGLYNRITKRIQLQPFTLSETEVYFKARNIRLNRTQIAELYMAIGGIPHYLREVLPGESTVQIIDRLCFAQDGVLRDEFEHLFVALFDQAHTHIALIKALADKPTGMTRTTLAKAMKIEQGGALSKVIEELIYSGFITGYTGWGHIKKETIFRLTDEYSLFYLHFIQKLAPEGNEIWSKFQSQQSYISWSGYAFENLCLKHTANIKKALGIAGIFSSSAAYHHKGKDGMSGCQIDLLIDRDDKAINLCEIKWSKQAYIVSKDYATALNNKIALFKHYSKTSKQVFLTMITSSTLMPNQHSEGIVDRALSLDDLFDN
jgi:uncharacterized protein